MLKYTRSSEDDTLGFLDVQYMLEKFFFYDQKTLKTTKKVENVIKMLPNRKV